MILTPHSHPDLFARIPGTVANVSKDIAPVEVAKLTHGEKVIWSKQNMRFPRCTKIGSQNGYWNFRPGNTYQLTFPEIEIPPNCIGELWPRSKLLRFGIIPARSAIWDPGYNGKGVAVILPTQIMKLGVGIETHTFVLWEFKGDAELYNGQFQHEGLDPRRVNEVATDIGKTAEKLNEVLGDQSETVSVKPKEDEDPLSPKALIPDKPSEGSVTVMEFEKATEPDQEKPPKPAGPIAAAFSAGAVQRPKL